jgi:hypothetical protein
MQWMSLVVVLGTATLLTQSPRFMMLKPSFIHFTVAAAMLRRGWMTRYLSAIARENLPETVVIGAGFGWAGLMVASERSISCSRRNRTSGSGAGSSLLARSARNWRHCCYNTRYSG